MFPFEDESAHERSRNAFCIFMYRLSFSEHFFLMYVKVQSTYRQSRLLKLPNVNQKRTTWIFQIRFNPLFASKIKWNIISLRALLPSIWMRNLYSGRKSVEICLSPCSFTGDKQICGGSLRLRCGRSPRNTQQKKDLRPRNVTQKIIFISFCFLMQ